jgi:hypothetical protein
MKNIILNSFYVRRISQIQKSAHQTIAYSRFCPMLIVYCEYLKVQLLQLKKFVVAKPWCYFGNVFIPCRSSRTCDINWVLKVLKFYLQSVCT